MQDPKDLVFRRRRKASVKTTVNPWTVIWWSMCAIGAIATVVIFLMTVDRTADSAGETDFSKTAVQAPAEQHYGFAEPEVADLNATTLDLTDEGQVPIAQLSPTGRYIFKCKSAEGVTRQSEPCDANEVTVEVTPINVQASQTSATSYSAPRVSAAQPATAFVEHREGRSEYQHSRCVAAKANREEVRRRVGLARTYDMIEQLDNQVRQACKAD